LGPASIPESTAAVADFDGYTPEPYRPAAQPEPVALQPELQPAEHRQEEAPAPAPVQDETAQEAEKAARRRSTVREKVSFLVNAQPEALPPVNHSPSEPPAPAATEEPVAGTADDTQPRKAGWWSRRFGNGE
jgi:ribonuclease E